VKHGERNVRCFLVFPKVKEKAAAVIVVHEIFGLTEWVRSVADQLPGAGYIAIAPDLLSGQTYSRC
jgi:carboxymethylenebutenolidase